MNWFYAGCAAFRQQSEQSKMRSNVHSIGWCSMRLAEALYTIAANCTDVFHHNECTRVVSPQSELSDPIARVVSPQSELSDPSLHGYPPQRLPHSPHSTDAAAASAAP